MSSRPLKVLIVSDDRPLLRHVSTFLDDFGYRAIQAAGQEQGRAALEGELPDLLIVDSELVPQGGAAWCAAVRSGKQTRYIYTLLAIRGGAPRDLVQAIEAGADDFLQKPVNHGEVLARLRTGARVLEYERRVNRRRSRDSITGLLSESAFYDRVRHELALTNGKPRQLACVMIDLDFFHRFRREHGRAVGDRVLNTVGEACAELAGRPAAAARLAYDRFCVLLPDTSVEKAVKWAERARAKLAELEIPHEEGSLRITASLGVVGCQATSEEAETVVQRAGEALAAAKQSGRNCVARHGEFDGEAESWADLAQPGKLFERTTVRDVMTPCTVRVHPDETVGQAVALFRQTRMEAIPVVDAEDHLVGLVTHENLRQQSAPGQTIAQVMTSKVPQFEESTRFSSLMDFFAQQNEPLTLIVRGQRPTGFVTRNSLRALIEPITASTFSIGGDWDTGDELLVPDLCPASSG